MSRTSVQDVPERLRQKLSADAKRRNLPINDVAVEALSQHYGEEFKPSGRYYTVPMTADVTDGIWILNLPEPLHQKIRDDAYQSGSTIRGTILARLNTSYRLPKGSSLKRPRGSR